MLKNDIGLSNFDKYIESLLKKEMQHREINACPHCGSCEIIKYGRYLSVQRFKCKKCGKTFSLSTNTVWQYTKKSYKTWIKFVEFFIEKQTLRYCSERLNISLATAFYWRHKILHAINSVENLKVLKQKVYISKTSMKENFKGSRNIYTMERKNVIVIGTIDSKETMLSLELSKDLWSYKLFDDKIYRRIEKDSYIIPYGDRYLYKIARDHNKGRVEQFYDEPRIKFFAKLVHLWFVDFKGIATKYLNKYLSWFILDNLKKKISWMDIIEFTSNLMTFIKTNDIGGTVV